MSVRISIVPGRALTNLGSVIQQFAPLSLLNVHFIDVDEGGTETGFIPHINPFLLYNARKAINDRLGPLDS